MAASPAAATGGGATAPAAPQKSDRLLKAIAIERGFRAVVLVAIGIVLMTHAHTDWGHAVNVVAHDLGFDPSRNGIQKLIDRVDAISPTKYFFFGAVAVAYGILEGVEGYGLWHRRRWAEYLTVVATCLLFIPEIDELAKRVTALKVAALIVNAVIVAYLLWRLRHHE
jgi:uncharacterized membrane protein (DUF2068 family)